MNKRGILVAIFLIVIALKFVAAQDADNTEKINKAFQCLEDEIRKTQSLTLQQATFSLLAGTGGSRVSGIVNDAKKSNENCWPKEGCKVKETAQIALAYKKQGKNNDGIISWLDNQTSIPRELTWYLQIIIDESKPASCIVGYDGQDYSAEIGEDGYTITASNGFGSCLTLEPVTSLLRVSDNCVEKKFSVSCSKSTQDFSKFKTAFWYVESGKPTAYVSQTTKSSGPGERHVAEINVKCFKKEPSSNGCDYESTLWATMAMYDKNKEIKDYLVYLKAVYDSSANQKYFPEAFLVPLTGRQNEFFSAVANKRVNARWDIGGSPYSLYYDTALGILAFGGKDSSESASTVAYLFENGVQTTQGCWNNNDVTDTAFLLYTMGVGKTSGINGGGGTIDLPGGNITNNTNGSSGGNPSFLDNTQCEDAGLYCSPSLVDCLTAGGFVEDQYNCAVFTDKCCTVQVNRAESCTDRGGRICRQTEECSSSTVSTSDGECCLDVCRVKEVDEGGDDVPYVTPATDEGGSGWWWIIILLVILILIVVLAIIYRDKIRLWWLKRKGKAKSSKLPSGPPGGPPPGFRPGPPRFGPPPIRPMVPQRPALRQTSPQAPMKNSGNDREMDDTLKKLKKISEG